MASFPRLSWSRVMSTATRRSDTSNTSIIQPFSSTCTSSDPGPGQQYALQARKHIATLRRARPGTIIELRWCPAHKGVTGNEKANEWAKIAAEEPNARGVEWLRHLDRAEARQWAGGRASKTKYKMLKGQRPDGTVAGSTKRLASRFYQVKTGHCLTKQYLH